MKNIDFRRLLTSLGIIILAGSAYAQEPAIDLPDSIKATWSYESTRLVTSPGDDKWWEGFDDPVLTDLIQRGETNSLDLRQALRRIEVARQGMLEAKSAYYPTLGISAGWTKEWSSGRIDEDAASGDHYFSLGLNFSWEIDLFGRVREQVNKNKAAMHVTKAEYSAAMISLASNIATAYINLRLAQGRIGLALRQIESQEAIVAIAEARFDAGLSSKLDVAQARTVLYSTRATLPEIENMERSAVRNLALLIGCYPDSLNYLIKDKGKLPNPFRMVDIGVPTDLLRRRPDIRAAEYQLAEAAASVGIAKNDFLPVLTLNGSFSTQSRKMTDMFKHDSYTYTLAPTLSWTIFDGMARNHRVAAAKENMEAGIENYNQTVLSAFIETENALGLYDSYLREILLMQNVCSQSDEAFTLALDRYKRGLSAFYDVMNSQLNVLQYRNTLLQTQASAFVALIKVYAAVAGAPE